MAYIKDFYTWPKTPMPAIQLMQDIKGSLTGDDEAFRDIIERSVAMGVAVKMFSSKLSVSQPTVNRWKNGLNLPHPLMRHHIYRWLYECLREF